MRSLYEPLNRKQRAATMRKNAQECEKAGFLLFAQINQELSEILDPPEPEEDGEDRDRPHNHK